MALNDLPSSDRRSISEFQTASI